MDARHKTDDSSLIEACLKKDFSAWSVFTSKYSGLIRASAKKRLGKYRLAGSRDDIEDIKQAVLESLWETGKLAAVRGRADISSWLAVVSANAAITFARKRCLRDDPVNVSIFGDVGNMELAELIPASGANPRDELANKELSEKICRSIESLSGKEKMIMKLNLFHGKKYRQIARIMSLPPGTVSSYIKRTKEKLRADLKNI